jgi:hypothetical protein
MQGWDAMDTLKKLGPLSIVAATVTLVAACSHVERGDTAVPGTTAYREYRYGVMNAQAPNYDAAIVEQLSAARCYREQTCDNVGGGKRYTSRAVCMEQMRGSIGNDLNTYNCPLGIDREKLEHCRLKIHEESCGDPIASFNRSAACQEGALCMK